MWELAKEVPGFLGDGVAAAHVFTRAGLVRPVRPDRPPRALAAFRRWGATPAGGYAVAAILYPDADALIDELGALTFAELDERTNRLAHALSDEGSSRVTASGVMCRDHRGLVEALIALSKLGADPMLLNTSFAGPQLTEVVKREEPRAIVYDERVRRPAREGALPAPRFVAWADDGATARDPRSSS